MKSYADFWQNFCSKYDTCVSERRGHAGLQDGQHCFVLASLVLRG